MIVGFVDALDEIQQWPDVLDGRVLPQRVDRSALHVGIAVAQSRQRELAMFVRPIGCFGEDAHGVGAYRAVPVGGCLRQTLRIETVQSMKNPERVRTGQSVG